MISNHLKVGPNTVRGWLRPVLRGDMPGEGAGRGVCGKKAEFGRLSGMLLRSVAISNPSGGQRLTTLPWGLLLAHYGIMCGPEGSPGGSPGKWRLREGCPELENAVNAAIPERTASDVKNLNLSHICRLRACLGGTPPGGGLRPLLSLGTVVKPCPRVCFGQIWPNTSKHLQTPPHCGQSES